MPKPEPTGSFVRWQSVTIAQLTYAINVTLTFSVATLGFQVSLLLDSKFNPTSWQKCVFALSLVLLLASVGLGIWCVVNRLRDFRATMKVAQLRENGASPDEIQPYRLLYEKLSQCTWGLFWLQIGSFGVGVLCAVLSVWLAAGQKLL